MSDIEMEPMSTPSGGSSSIGDAVSGRGEEIAVDEDDLYYIPERRPSLDLGPNPMDTSNWIVDQAPTPAGSYTSLITEGDSVQMDEEDMSSTRVQLDRTDSYSSCYSLDSDDCEKRIPKVRSKDEAASGPSNTPELIPALNEIKHPSVTVAFTFKAITDALKKLTERDLSRFKMLLWKRYPQSFNTPPQGMDMVDLVDRLLERYDLQVSLQITKALLEELGQKKILTFLQNLCIRNEVRYDLCETLKRTYGEVDMQGEKMPFDEAYVNLHITSTFNNGPNIEHEVMEIEKLDSNRDPGDRLFTKDILSVERMARANVRFILLTGMAGSGKSMAVRRLILDWVERRSHEHVSFLFPLPFCKLKQFEGAKVSLVQIIQTLYPETKKLQEDDYRCDDCKVMFIFDGLDEYCETFDFENIELLGHHGDPTNLRVIVINLLRGRLLYRGLFLVTSRPPVKRCIPWDTHYDEIEMRGFCEPEKDEYFKTRFKNPDHLARVIQYIDSVKTFRIMCHLPLFCSLVADEWHRAFREQGPRAELPRSVTYMYTKLLLVLTRERRACRAPDWSQDQERDFLMKLGRLALTMLEQRQFKMTKSDWKDTGIDEEEAVINSGLCTQYVTKPYVLVHEKVLSFMHPTMQEYLAALYAFLSFRNKGKNIFDQQLKNKVKGIFKGQKGMELYKSAVDKSLTYEDGRLDNFLRFLFGMALKINQELLQPFCVPSVKWPNVIEDSVSLIRKRLRENPPPGRTASLQRCLEELYVLASS